MVPRDDIAPSGRKSMFVIMGRSLFIAIAIGVAVRLVLMPLVTYDFDIYHWAMTIGNFQSGNGLYGLAGYYYTPVWGYILGFLSLIQDFFVNSGVFGMRFTDLLPVEGLAHPFHTATITQIDFNVTVKIALLICDILVAYLVYWLIKDRTGDENKASIGLALWFLSPPVMYMCGVQAQFDTFSALLFMLTVVAVYKDRCFLAGFLFATTVLLKFFPMFCAVVLVAYVLKKHSSDGQAYRKLAAALVGGALGLTIWIMPEVLSGTLFDMLSFVTNRVAESQSLMHTVVSYLSTFLALTGMLYFGYRMKVSEGDTDSDFLKYMLMAMASAMLMAFGPQYIIVILPLLAVFAMEQGGRRHIICWALISAGAFAMAISYNNFSIFSALAEATGWVSPEWVVAGLSGMNSTFLGVTWVVWFSMLSLVFQLIGVWLIFFYHFEDAIRGRIGPVDRFMTSLETRRRNGI